MHRVAAIYWLLIATAIRTDGQRIRPPRQVAAQARPDSSGSDSISTSAAPAVSAAQPTGSASSDGSLTYGSSAQSILSSSGYSSSGSISASSAVRSNSASTSGSASGSASAASVSGSVSASASGASTGATGTSSTAAGQPAATGSSTAGPNSTSINATSPDVKYPLDSTQRSVSLSPKWQDAHQRAQQWLSNWTMEEKVNLTTGMGWQIGRCLGNIPPIPSKGFPGLCLQDSPLGVRLVDFASAFPAGINVASTFDKDLMYQRGLAMGQEFKGKGAHVALGPMTNMMRTPEGGRNWEGFGGDPYLAGHATEQTIKGLQDAGVQACVKHFIGNEQERNRTTSSSNIDDRAMREIYTHPFLRAVAADVASVMCSYNLVNNSWACQNSETMNGILKTDFGFQGYVMSDWQATMSGVLSVNSGLDMSMPGDIVFNSGTTYFGSNLTTAVKNGSVESARLDDMAERILSAYLLLGQDKKGYPEINFDSHRRHSDVNNSHIDVRADHDQLIRRIGAASTVLLKNKNGSLPLKKPRSVALIGFDLGPNQWGPNGCDDRECNEGTLAMGWGSGTAEFPYLIDPLLAMSVQTRKDGSTLNWWFNDADLAGATDKAINAEVAVVGISSDSGEQYITVDGNEGDRNNLDPWRNGTALVKAIAANNNNTIVVIHSVGPIIIEEWIDHPNVTAVLWAGLPGQESGNALLDVMYGAYNPSGRLPYTIAKKREDYPADLIYVNTAEPPHPQVDYNESIMIDYRHFQSKNITPRFEFGFGLSYTKFNISNLQLVEMEKAQVPVDNSNRTVGYHLSDWLQRPRWRVTVDIQNIGDVNGCEVPQLYLEYPASSGEPPRVLRDFTRLNLDPWEASQVAFVLSQYDVSIWDTKSQQWVIPEGKFKVVVAKSSMDHGLRKGFCPSGKKCS